MSAQQTNLQKAIAEIGKIHGKGIMKFASELSNLPRIPTSIFELDALLGGGIPMSRVTMFTGEPSGGKGLPLDEVVPTPDGFKKVGDVRVGDTLFTEGGGTTAVSFVSEVHHKPCYRIEFSDGTSIVTDEDHLWQVDRRHPGGRRTEDEVISTGAMFEEGTKVGSDRRNRFRVHFAGAVQYPERDLPVDPYLLGIWLGDGHVGNGRITTPDTEVLDAFRAAGYDVGDDSTPDRGSMSVTIYRFIHDLRSAGVIDDKHVPEPYLTASVGQRLALLQGLMDSDGTVDKGTGKVTFDNTNRNLADAVQEIVRSLGFHASISDRVGKIDGVGHKVCYRVHFSELGRFRPFRLARHLERFRTERTQSRNYRYVEKIVPVESVPTVCFQVEDPSRLFVVGRAYHLTHNTTAALLTAANAQRLDRNTLEPLEWVDGVPYKKEGGEVGDPMNVVFLDSEGTFDPIWAKSLGVNLDTLVYAPAAYQEQAYDIVVAMIRTGEVDLIILDSLAAMAPSTEMAQATEDQNVGVAARINNKGFRKIAGEFNRLVATHPHAPAMVIINQLREKVGVMFGCERGDVVVPFVDGTSATMREIAENKISKEVWGFDERLGITVPAPIVNWFHNGRVDSHDDWVHIKANVPDTKNGVAGLVVTPTHKVMTSRGWVEAREITQDDKLLTHYTAKANDAGSFRDFLVGTLVGDSHIAPSGRQNGYIVLEDVNNEEYVRWKADKLAAGFDFTEVGFTTLQGRETFRARSAPSYELGRIREDLVGQRSFGAVASHFSALSLAVWYMDDGSITTSGRANPKVVISAKRFRNNVYEAEAIRRVLGGLGVDATFNHAHGYIHIPRDSQGRFFNLVARYVPACMQYKLPEAYKGRYEDFALTVTGVKTPVFVPVKSVGKATSRSGWLDKYDIEVAGCHSFLAGNSANGFLTHNSPETTPGGRGQEFFASVKIKVWPVALGKAIKVDNEIVGRTSTFKIEKNKLNGIHGDGQFTVYTRNYGPYKKGETDSYNQVLEWAIRLDLVEKGGAWLTLPNGERFQGKTKTLDYLAEHPDQAQALYEQVAVGVKEFYA